MNIAVLSRLMSNTFLSGSLFILMIGTLCFCNSEKSSKPDESHTIEDRVVMAVFAHPDDEISVGPILARYAREGARVQLIIVTDGRYGTGQTDLKPGKEIVGLRIKEGNCAASNLGIEKPIWLGYHDQLKLRDGFFGHVPYVQDLMRDLDSLVASIQPDVIITWGPDGGSNHMDHRIVGASITQVYLSKTWEKTKALYYVGTPSSHIEVANSKLLRGIDDQYLTTRIAYSEEDREKAISALACYKSQFSAETMEMRTASMRTGEQTVYFRPVVGVNTVSNDLFEMPGE